MKIDRENQILFSIFILFQLILLVFNMGIGREFSIFIWYCDHIMLLFAIAFIFNRKDLVRSFVNIGLIPQLIWLLDLALSVVTGEFLFGFTEYVFSFSSILAIVITIAGHLFSTLVAILFSIDEKPQFKETYYSLVYVLSLYIITLLLTTPVENVNCVYGNCLGFWNFVYYTYLWPVLVYILLVIPSHYLQKLVYKYLRD